MKDLRIGDLVATRLDGETVFQPITWIRHRSTDIEDLGQADACPVCTRADACGNDVPHRDLHVTPEHCIFLDGEPDFRLLTNSGLENRPTLFGGRLYAFVIPDGANSVRLVSGPSRHSDTIGPFVDDRRELGVLVGAIGFGVARRRIVIDAHQQTSLPGWHAVETDRRIIEQAQMPFCRWTCLP